MVSTKQYFCSRHSSLGTHSRMINASQAERVLPRTHLWEPVPGRFSETLTCTAALIRGCKNPKTTSSDTRISIYQMLRCRVLACLLQFCRPTAVLEAVWELSACALTSLRWKGAGVSGQHAHQSFGTESTPFKSTPQVLTAQTNPNQECVDFQTDLFL